MEHRSAFSFFLFYVLVSIFALTSVCFASVTQINQLYSAIGNSGSCKMLFLRGLWLRVKFVVEICIPVACPQSHKTNRANLGRSRNPRAIWSRVLALCDFVALCSSIVFDCKHKDETLRLYINTWPGFSWIICAVSRDYCDTNRCLRTIRSKYNKLDSTLEVFVRLSWHPKVFWY